MVGCSSIQRRDGKVRYLRGVTLVEVGGPGGEGEEQEQGAGQGPPHPGEQVDRWPGGKVDR